jgi:hypothetical protein
MNSKLIKTLALVCFLLVFLIVMEWLYAKHLQEKQLLSLVIAPSKQALPNMPTIDLNLQPEESYVDLVNRPLFIAGRKPAPETEQSQAQVAGNAAATFDWKLNGIYTTKKGLMALLTRTVVKTPGNKYRKVILDDNIEDWKVTEIHKDKVQLTQGSIQKILPLRKPKPKTQEQNSATPPNSRSRNASSAPEPTNDPSENDDNANTQ